MSAALTQLRFTTIGSVDDGKSTLIGRLLNDLGAIHEDHLEAVRRASPRGLDLALVTDGLRAEREQGITIDVAYRFFTTRRRRYIIADTPGHEQYTRNMATGASTADAAVILVDARHGVQSQTRRHATLAWLLGIRKLCVAVNKMDLVAFSEPTFRSVEAEIQALAETLPGSSLAILPLCARDGDGVVERGGRMPWFDGPPLLDWLESLEVETGSGTGAGARPFRFPVQGVVRGAEGRRHYTGQICSGSLRPGDTVALLPGGQPRRVAGIHSFEGPLAEAHAPMSVSLTLEGHHDVGRGDLLADPATPPQAALRFRAVLFWMGETPLDPRQPLVLLHTTRRTRAEITRLESLFDLDTLRFEPGGTLASNGIARVEVTTEAPIFCDPYQEDRATGSFILVDPASHATLAAGLIESPLEAPAPQVQAGAGLVLWLTGLSSAGKTTLGTLLVERLRAEGRRAELLDGDEMRRHLCRDLGFSRQDRDENVRRLAYVASLLERNGVIAVVCAISPYRAARAEARQQAGRFVEVHVDAPLETCEARDVKGLYHRARAGLLQGFTGVDDPYEPPLQPEVVVRTDQETVEASGQRVLGFLRSILA